MSYKRRGFTEITGEEADGAKITVCVPMKNDGRVAEVAEDCVLWMDRARKIDISFRGFRPGIDEDYPVEVINPYPWSKKGLVSNRRIDYVSRRGWIGGAAHFLTNWFRITVMGDR